MATLFSTLKGLLKIANTEKGSMSLTFEPSRIWIYSTSDLSPTCEISEYIQSTSGFLSLLHERSAFANSSYNGIHVNIPSICLYFSGVSPSLYFQFIYHAKELLQLCDHGCYLLISHRPFLSLPLRLMISRSRNFLICFSMPRLLSPVFSAISVADNAGSESSNNSTRFSFTPNFTPNFAPNSFPNFTPNSASISRALSGSGSP